MNILYFQNIMHIIYFSFKSSYNSSHDQNQIVHGIYFSFQVLFYFYIYILSFKDFTMMPTLYFFISYFNVKHFELHSLY